MAWTAEVGEVRKLAEVLVVAVRYFKDGVLVAEKRYRHTGAPPVEWVEKLVKQEIANLSGVASVSIPLGVVKEPTPEPTVEPPDLVLRTFRRKMEKARLIKELIDFKVILATDPKVAALIDELKTGLLTYWDSL